MATQQKGPRTNDGRANTNDGRVKFSDREERNNRRNRPEGNSEMDHHLGPDNRGKREFDRQSGMMTTGVKSVDKRDGSGSYNWGSDKDQIEEQLNATPAGNSDHDSSTENVEKPADDTGANAEGEEPKEEESVKEMTLDEWKAMQGARNKPSFNIRRAGEGRIRPSGRRPMS
ncbi:putative plasminogen activator inhibitor 1 RNA-binding protein isoform X1 [Penaeus vannamei]|uniref:Putative plasminogen activator inhibitor 1 RNA-binding protein isoform X1 n=1 Tax=Penaeus vannamei TaxID=6689 RepID=A0A3R7QCB8_PENVA|nr:putative plasminogen activator inhibitor 1 RNA-binding protein isoform X1 [Penaeus vannamei]